MDWAIVVKWLLVVAAAVYILKWIFDDPRA